MPNALEHLHDQGFLHYDLKPENMLWRSSSHAVLCDFGLCASYTQVDKSKTVHVPQTDVKYFVGTRRWCSIRAQQLQSLDRACELQNLCFVLLFLQLGNQLPWDSAYMRTGAEGKGRANGKVPSAPSPSPLRRSSGNWCEHPSLHNWSVKTERRTNAARHSISSWLHWMLVYCSLGDQLRWGQRPVLHDVACECYAHVKRSKIFCSLEISNVVCFHLQ